METNYSTRFADYKNDYSQLVGKYVLNETGMSFNTNLNKRISKIEKVNKTSFKITGSDTLYDFNGHAKGLTGRMNMGVINICHLLTEDEVIQVKKEFYEFNKACVYRTEITNKVAKLSYEQLKQVSELIKSFNIE